MPCSLDYSRQDKKMNKHTTPHPDNMDDFIKHIAKLARIGLSDDELKQYHDIHEIFEMIEQIDEVDTSDIAPLYNPIELEQRLREDIVTEANEREKLQKIAPNNIEAGIYLVPEVFEE